LTFSFDIYDEHGIHDDVSIFYADEQLLVIDEQQSEQNQHYTVKGKILPSSSSTNTTDTLILNELTLRYQSKEEEEEEANGSICYDGESNTFRHVISAHDILSDCKYEAKQIVIPRRIVFVIDKSDSMRGDKWSQMVSCTVYALQRLKENYDRFSLILFDHHCYQFPAHSLMLLATSKNIHDAVQYIEEQAEPGGATDFGKPLNAALQSMKEDALKNACFVNQIVFVTDGQDSNFKSILNEVHRINDLYGIDKYNQKVSILAFGIGRDSNHSQWIYDTDHVFLRSLATDNNGFYRRIKKSALQSEMKAHFDLLAQPLLTNIRVQYDNMMDIPQLTQHEFSTMYTGNEFVICGKFRNVSDEYKLEITINAMTCIKMNGVNCMVKPIEICKKFSVSFQLNSDVQANTEKKNARYFTERTWAYFKLQQLQKRALMMNYYQETEQVRRMTISVKVTSIKVRKKSSGQSNEHSDSVCNICVSTNHGEWTVQRTLNELETFHNTLTKNSVFRGVHFPKFPVLPSTATAARKNSGSAAFEFSQYLSQILHRSVLLGDKDVLDFVAAPANIRSIAVKVMENERMPIRQGVMQKEGGKWKGLKTRHFVLFHNFLLQYFQSADAFQLGLTPKGCIDLTTANKIVTFDKKKSAKSADFQIHIQTPNRVWKLRCDNKAEREEWVKSLKQLLQNNRHNGYIMDFDQVKKSSQSHNSDYRNDAESATALALKYQFLTPPWTTMRIMNNDKDENDQHDEEWNDECIPSMEKITSCGDIHEKQTLLEEQRQQMDDLQMKIQSLLQEHKNGKTSKSKKLSLQTEIANEYAQQLAVQRDEMTRTTQEIQRLHARIREMRREQVATEQTYQQEIEVLSREIADYREMNKQQEIAMRDQDDVIEKIEHDVDSLRNTIVALQSEQQQHIADERMHSLSDILYKIDGEQVSKFKFHRMREKNVVFVSGCNHLFFYDSESVKSESTSNSSHTIKSEWMIVEQIVSEHDHVERNIDEQPWIMLVCRIGDREKFVLFVLPTMQLRSKWIEFVRKSLLKPKRA